MQATHPYYGAVTIRYCKLQGNAEGETDYNSRAATMRAYGIGSRGDHICLVWKNECYDVVTGWSRISGPFGVTFGSANVAVHIVLPDSAPVKNNTYRDCLLRKDDSGDLAEVGDFGDLVFHNRPQWLVEYVDEQSRRNTTGNNVMERLREYLRDMMTSGARRDVIEPGGEEEGERGARTRVQRVGAGSGGGGARDHSPGAPAGAGSTDHPDRRRHPARSVHH